MSRGVVHVDFYFEDFLSGVTYLEPEARGVYITLCALFWSHGGSLPDDDRANARACNATGRTYRRIKDGLVKAGKIEVRDGLICQARAAEELHNAESRIQQRIDAGKAGGKAKAAAETSRKVEKNGSKTAKKVGVFSENETENSNENNESGLAPPHTQIQTHLSVSSEAIASSETTARRRREVDPDDFPANAFDAWYSGYPHKVGRGAAEKAFDQVRRGRLATFVDLTAGRDRYVRTKPPDRPWCNPATWLNQRRWLDAPDEQPALLRFDHDQRPHPHPRPSDAPESRADRRQRAALEVLAERGAFDGQDPRRRDHRG